MSTMASDTSTVRVASWITAIDVLVASTFSLLGLAKPELILPAGALATDTSFVFAAYAAARTIPLALVTLLAIYKRHLGVLLTLGWLAGLVQALDAAIGLYQHDIGKTIGPLVLAILQFYAMFRLRASPEAR